jgi:hypothetical protein
MQVESFARAWGIKTDKLHERTSAAFHATSRARVGCPNRRLAEMRSCCTLLSLAREATANAEYGAWAYPARPVRAFIRAYPLALCAATRHFAEQNMPSSLRPVFGPTAK